jgi:uncharacterized glyoxalase superfamily protein PhnB
MADFQEAVDFDGNRSFTGRDLEGHIWNFSTYDPWKMNS